LTVVNLVMLAGALVTSGFVIQALSNGLVTVALGTIITAATCVVSLRGISSRLGGGHRMIKLAVKFPGGRLVCGV
jgi:hypothetical protein